VVALYLWTVGHVGVLTPLGKSDEFLRSPGNRIDLSGLFRGVEHLAEAPLGQNAETGGIYFERTVICGD
jgi:hypothetical protein